MGNVDVPVFMINIFPLVLAPLPASDSPEPDVRDPNVQTKTPECQDPGGSWWEGKSPNVAQRFANQIMATWFDFLRQGGQPYDLGGQAWGIL